MIRGDLPGQLDDPLSEPFLGNQNTIDVELHRNMCIR
jgi:hypothetical protein